MYCNRAILLPVLLELCSIFLQDSPEYFSEISERYCALAFRARNFEM